MTPRFTFYALIQGEHPQRTPFARSVHLIVGRKVAAVGAEAHVRLACLPARASASRSMTGTHKLPTHQNCAPRATSSTYHRHVALISLGTREQNLFRLQFSLLHRNAMCKPGSAHATEFCFEKSQHPYPRTPNWQHAASRTGSATELPCTEKWNEADLAS